MVPYDDDGDDSDNDNNIRNITLRELKYKGQTGTFNLINRVETLF